MPQPKLNNRACALLSEAPRTVSDLSASERVEYVDGDLESVALLGTQLSEALITSNNGAALTSDLGGLAALQTTAHPFRLSDRRMTFRFDPAASVHVLNTSGRAGTKTNLAVSDTAGTVALKVETNGGYDTRVICVLDAIAPPTENPQRRVDARSSDDFAPNIIQLTAIRSARRTWLQNDSGAHLNDLCTDGGVLRSATLPHVGKNKAWRIIAKVLPSFLTYLLQHKIGFAPLVTGSGFILGSVFKNGSPQQLDRMYWIANGPQNFALDITQVAAAWVTVCGPALHVELYDEDRRSIVTLVPDRNVNLKHWNNLLASLPEVRVLSE